MSPASAPARRPARTGFLTGTGGIAIQIGLAEKFYRGYVGEVPLVLKLNGKAGIASDAAAVSPVSVADAVRLGADAVGCTL